MSKLIGIDKQLDAIQMWLEDWKSGIYPTKRLLILVGPPGVGKTSSVYAVSEKLGFEVCEFNTSDTRDKTFFEDLYLRVQTKPIVPTVYLLDEVDGVDEPKALIKLLNVARNPVILTANDPRKLPQALKDGSLILRFWRVSIRDVVKVVGKVEDYSVLSGDVRQSQLVKFGSQGYEPSKDPMDKFLKGKLDNVNRWILVTILDNAHRWLYGFELYKLLVAITVADKCMRPEVLEPFKGIGRDWEFSYYYSKRKQK